MPGYVYVSRAVKDAIGFAMRRADRSGKIPCPTAGLVAIAAEEVRTGNPVLDEDEFCDHLELAWKVAECPWKEPYLGQEEKISLGFGLRFIEAIKQAAHQKEDQGCLAMWTSILEAEYDPECDSGCFYDAAAGLGRTLPDVLSKTDPKLLVELEKHGTRVRVKAPLQVAAIWQIDIKDWESWQKRAMPLTSANLGHAIVQRIPELPALPTTVQSASNPPNYTRF